MRIAWYSNSPVAPTGYGTQTVQVISRLKQDGHDVAVLGNFGHVAGIIEWYGIPVYPQGRAQYSVDVIEDQSRIHFAGEPGWVITLYDVWVLGNLWGDGHVASWVPVDHYPVVPQVAAWAKKHRAIAMSRFGQQALEQLGVQSVYIPHALDLNVWKPTPSDLRSRMVVSDDQFLVTINAANVGNFPPRKAWHENLQAFASFARDHKDAVLYLHTDLTRMNGVDILYWLKFLNINPDQVRLADQTAYIQGLIEQAELIRIYSASDVLLGVSMGEGFGLAVPEAMACGTPAIVTDFSAQPEIVGDTGWLVGSQPYADEGQKSFLATPFISDIRDRLEEAYAERGTDKARIRSEAAIAKVHADYDADTVYQTMWRPLLAEMEDDLRPIVKKQGKSKAAQRRKLQAVK